MNLSKTAPEIDLETAKGTAVVAVQSAITDSFLIMAGMEAVIGQEYSAETAVALRSSVAAVIGWAGAWSGSGVLECTPEFACDLCNRMLGTEHTELTEDALDAVAEMANIIFGGMKTKLECHFGVLGLSTPTVLFGDNVGVRGSGKTFTTIPVRIDHHTLQIKLFLATAEPGHPGEDCRAF